MELRSKVKHFNNWTEAYFKKHKRGIKRAYIVFILLAIVYAIWNIKNQVTMSAIESAFKGLDPLKIFLVILCGSISVIPMAIYDYTYAKKTSLKLGLIRLLKDSFIINTFTNACGGGGFVGATLRPKLLGKPSSQVIQTAKVVAQIALFTMIGLVTNDLLAMALNLTKLPSMPLVMKVGCFVWLAYAIVPFIMNNKILNRHDRLMLFLGSSLEWLFALGFFLFTGFLMGIHFNLFQGYLAVCFAGIIGAASFIPGGLGSFDSAIILGMHQLGLSTSTVVAWAFVYRVCYYWIPFIIGGIMLLCTELVKHLANKK